MKKEHKIVTELTPDLADKIWKSIQKRRYDEQVSREAVLHHLKQLKAQMGKKKKYTGTWKNYHTAIAECMQAIDNKIFKLTPKAKNNE